MSSRQKRKQARVNGAKATGAKSPEGIKISSANALKHGLTAKAHVLSNESQPMYDILRQEYIKRFQPEDVVELDLVDDMVGARWRLRRIAIMQTSAMDLQMDLDENEIKKQFQTIDQPTRLTIAFGKLTNKEKSMDLLLRYEVTYSRMFDRARKALQQLQAKRPPAEDSDTCEELRNEPPPPPEPAAEAPDLRQLLAGLSEEQLCDVAKQMNIEVSPAIRDEIDRT